MHGSVGAPGTPAEGARNQILRVIQTGGPAQAQIGGRKGVWMPQGSQGDVVRSPITDAAYFSETTHGSFEEGSGGENPMRLAPPVVPRRGVFPPSLMAGR